MKYTQHQCLSIENESVYFLLKGRNNFHLVLFLAFHSSNQFGFEHESVIE